MEHQITVFAGPASGSLGSAICQPVETRPAIYECRRFPDGETLIELHESVRGRDVCILQSTSPPVDQHLIELLHLADACRRAGAARLTAVIPYFGYARQDRRSSRRSLGARVAAKVLGTASVDRLMLIDAHTPAIEGFFDMPLDHLTAVPLLARAVAPFIGDTSIVVAPDLGAVKLARAYSNQLHVPMAFVHKTRLDGDAVEAHSVIGHVRGRQPVTHGLLVGRAREILEELPLARLVITDTVSPDLPAPLFMEICSVAPLVATAIERNHSDESLADLRAPA
jgi:ribose-phosphate pyrophosphokinase